MKDLPARIREVLSHFAVTQSKLAEIIGVSHPQVSHWLSGKNTMPQSTAMAIQAALGVRWQWLLNGDGEMTLSERPHLTDQERDLLDAFHRLPDKRREFIVGFTQAAALEEARSKDS